MASYGDEYLLVGNQTALPFQNGKAKCNAELISSLCQPSTKWIGLDGC